MDSEQLERVVQDLASRVAALEQAQQARVEVDLVGLEDAATYAKVSTRTVRRWADQNVIGQYGKPGKPKFSLTELRAVMAETPSMDGGGL